MSNPQVTGMVKLFYQNYLLSDTPTYSATSGAGASNIGDIDRSTKWQSSGSSDTIVETIQVTFSQSLTMDRVVLINMNFKTFSVKYWDGSAWVDFTGVFYSQDTVVPVGIYGSSVYGGLHGYAISGANIDNNELNTRYFAFDSVSTTSLLITVTKTIIPNAQKFMHELYAGVEIGTFSDDIMCKPNSYSATVRASDSMIITKSNGGRIRYEKSDKYRARISLKQVTGSNDTGILDEVFTYGELAIWPCGGKNDYTTRGMRIQDFYSVVVSDDQESDFDIGRDPGIGVNQSFGLDEQ